ncbi:MAG: response regulator [Candidatus Hermodarchaeota archaeon]
MSRIFIIEDDDLTRELYCEILDFLGYKIIGYATNGEEAVVKFQNFPTKPDLIIMDYRLPLKNGLDAMKEILLLDGTSKVLFASADNNVKDLALNSGAVDFIQKPFDITILQQKIQKYVSK